ncbi:MAG: BREX system P-loop protein BrxC [Phormidesmis sp.]
MLLKDLFANDVTRDIPPVVYFHEQNPAKVAAEVGEYIITGGYPTDDPRWNYIKASGIHEQFVRLLTGLIEELQKGAPALPASWISGFYGSGKSSFAKLLGLALDGLVLPGGEPLATALLRRDDSPKAAELTAQWQALQAQVNPISVVFDIGAAARDDEQIHSAVKRQLQRRLGYCGDIHYVADHELKLELEGEWENFLQTAQQVLGEPWDAVKTSPVADEEFSRVLHEMNPALYTDPLSWYESRAGANTGVGSSAEETTRAIAQMLEHRAPGKTLFVVVDEVSQYIFQNTNRMLALQSFVQALGQRLKGKVWLLATGQQKLEDSDDESNINKLKDRFPPKLRVHLAPTNIRDVVHKRLLKKKADQVGALAALFDQHRSDLKLHGYECESIAKESFLEVYPLLPGYVDLLMQITSNLRSRSTKAKGDDHAIRGLLQLLGELFREQRLGEQELGRLITLDNIFDVQQSALDNDVQTTLVRLFAHEDVVADGLAVRAAKAVALLELIQEQVPTTPALVAQCLYDRMGLGNQTAEVAQALEKLRSLSLLSYSEKSGYKIQSSAGQEWARERDRYTVTPDASSEIVAQKLKELLGSAENPKYQGNGFRWAAYYSDSRQRQDERLQVPSELAVVTIDFRYVPKADDQADEWIKESANSSRIFWVVSKQDGLEGEIKRLGRSRYMLSRYDSRRSTLSDSKRRLLSDEQSQSERLETRVKNAVAEAFVSSGEIYFRGRQIDRQPYGSSFASLLTRLAEGLLPDIYSRYVNVAVTTTELLQLLEQNLSGISSKFMTEGLGILALDEGKYVPNCEGEVPTRVEQYVLEERGISGSALLAHFGGPPYGYPADVVRACLAGLLRAGKVQIRAGSGDEINSVRDPGARDVFTKAQDLKRADVLPPSDKGVTRRDLNAICQFFDRRLGDQLDRDKDAVADRVHERFREQAGRLRQLEQRYSQLPGRVELPESLQKLQKALEDCTRSRQVERTLLSTKRNLDVLDDGVYELGRSLSELTDDKVGAVRRAMAVQTQQVAQLRQVSRLSGIEAEVAALKTHFEVHQTKPWDEVAELLSAIEAVEAHYQRVRLDLIEQQEQTFEEAYGQLQYRQGYPTLTEEKAAQVVRPLREALTDTTKEALQPPLVELKDPARRRLGEAAEQANRYLDEAIAQETGTQTIEFSASSLLSKQEVGSVAEVDALLGRLRGELVDKLESSADIRIRLI